MKFIFLVICLFSALFSIAQPANDNFAGAIDVTPTINACSANAAYTTTAATADLNKGTCWNTGGGAVANVWFKFTAPASGKIDVTVDIGGVKGTQQRSQIAIWQSNGTTQVTCNRYSSDPDDVILGATALTPGLTYYISVDVQATGYRGTFTLCLSNAVDYDYYEGATDVTATINSCSADAAYTTIGATSDKNAGSCWNTGGSPVLNRWFKFTAPASGQINVTVDIGGAKGTQQRTQLALWQSNGTTQVSCNLYVNDTDDVILGAIGLTPGSTYYISVDTQAAGFRGTFTLCLSDAVDYDYYEGATDVTATINSCSVDAAYTTTGATSDKNAGGCWNTGGTPVVNRWFKFTAPASGQINVTVDIGGTKGTLQRSQVALWQSNGTTQVSCNRYVNDTDDVVIGATTLTPGSTYYISVDAQATGYRGSFTLCLSNAVDYDYYEGAIDVTATINSCSADAAYTTTGGTSDKNASGCWNTGGTPVANRWFKFTAPASGQINVTVDIGGSKGTQQRSQVGLWQSNGITQVFCNRYVNDTDDVVIGATTLTPGATYYISVDAQAAGYRGSFTLCLSNAVDYDYYEGAIDVTATINSCSADATYNTTGATSDKNAGGCWNTGGTPVFNRWFKFTAPASGQINVTVDIGGTKGTQQRSQVALWQSNGTTQVSCNRYVNDTDDVVIGATTLTPGTTYYISVDAQAAGYRGSFTLCLSNAVDYDYYEGAIDVTAIINSCSADAVYTTIGGTSDKNSGSCWNTGGTPVVNRWFKFTAPASGQINVTVDIGGTKGTQQRTQLALWQSNGVTQVSCNLYVNDTDDVVIGATTLTPGATYYISVDAQAAGYRGSFTLCLSNAVDYDYYEGAIDITATINSCSADAAYNTTGATADKNAGGCWNTGGTPVDNRWFKFTAPASGQINVTVDIGGTKGTQQRSQVALWQSNGTTQVSCNRYVNDTDDVVLGAIGLTPGSTYYISVDAQAAGYRGSFTLCLTNAVDYDYYEGAIDVTATINSCSADAAYNTTGATSDKNAGGCWNTGGTPVVNRWFKFTAPASGQVNVTIDIGGTKGTQQRTQVALWQSNGITQISCNRYSSDTDDVVLGATTLTPGSTYYISVDAQATGYRGTFTLCLTNAVDYDYYEGALDVTATINSCSADAAYTTIGATSDKNAGSCWNTGGPPVLNRWFKFTAPASGQINVTVDIGGTKGTQQRTQLTLWQTNGTTQISCNRYSSDTDDVVIGATTLTAGTVYYISVDTQASGFRGTFTVCLSDAVDYDFYQGALNVNGLINSCSADAAYTTIGATSDMSAGSCWNSTGGSNRWFKFTATTNQIDVQVNTGGSEGTLQYPYVALWASNGTTQLACQTYTSQYGDLAMNQIGLTIGSTYYISVDNHNGTSGYRGTFKLCLTDAADYDFYEGAYDLTDLNNWCSTNALFSTVNASKDKNSGSCWNTIGGTNRWFKFVAVTANATIQAKTGAAEGTLQYPYMALWSSDGVTQLGCAMYSSQYSDLSIVTSALVVGNTYYVSVDNHNGSTGYRGTFTVCLNNVGTTYYSRGSGIWNANATWSTAGYGGIAASSFPNAGDVANIQGVDVTIPSNQQAAEFYLDVANAATSLTVNAGVSLTVNGKATLNNSGNNVTGAINLLNNSTLFVNDRLIFNRLGGNAAFGMTMNTGSTLTVNKTMDWTSTSGTVSDNLFTANGSAKATVNLDINFNSTAGRLIKLQFNNTSILTVKRDINFVATAAGQEAIELNNTAQLKIGRNFVRGASPFGSLTSNNTSTVEYNGTVYYQNFSASAGSGADAFYYTNVVINNTRPTTPQITMEGAVTVNGDFTLTSGVISSTSTNILNLKSNTATTIGSSSSYVDGPMTYEVASSVANTIRNFPIGKSGTYRPAILKVSHSDNTTVVYTAEHFKTPATSLGYTLAPTTDKVSGVRYWHISRQAVANLISARVTLYYGIGNTDGVTDYTKLTVVKNINGGTVWNDIGGVATGNGTGSILSGTFNSFSDITIANLTTGTNPLPITLKSFTGKVTESGNQLRWTTATEKNNDHFEIQRSVDGVNFSALDNVPCAGNGNSNVDVDYNYLDKTPALGANYYRLKQIDLDGKFLFSNIVLISNKSEAFFKVSIYPNPIIDHHVNLTVQTPYLFEPLKISVIDLTGKVIYQRVFKIDHADQAVELDLRGKVTDGLYIIKSEVGTYTDVKKILITD